MVNCISLFSSKYKYEKMGEMLGLVFVYTIHADNAPRANDRIDVLSCNELARIHTPTRHCQSPSLISHENRTIVYWKN